MVACARRKPGFDAAAVRRPERLRRALIFALPSGPVREVRPAKWTAAPATGRFVDASVTRNENLAWAPARTLRGDALRRRAGRPVAAVAGGSLTSAVCVEKVT